MKFTKWSYIAIPVSIVLFGLLIYPTLYKYDKLDQRYPIKINRITGEAHILRGDGWVKTGDSSTYEEKMLAYKQEIEDLIKRQNDDIAAKVSTSVKSDVISSVSEQLANVEEEITAYKNHEIDPNNYFTLGDTKETVKKIMGIPDKIDSYFDTWYYGFSRVKFKNNKVIEWYNQTGNLRTK